MYTKYPQGSKWRKWDLHIHAPSKYTCAKKDNFIGQNLEEKKEIFLKELSQIKDIPVIGVTDYFSLDAYKFVLENKDKLNNIDLVLPNIELRVSPVTSNNRKINLHIIPNITKLSINEIERFLYSLTFGAQKYTCNPNDLINLGNTSEENLSDERAFKIGLNKFLISYDVFFDKLSAQSNKFKNNLIVGVSNNSNDGVSGIKDLPGIRDIIYHGVDFIFSSQESDKNYFLGKTADSEKQIIKKYGSLMPCLHGSDYHGSRDGKIIGIPDLKRYCWIKADPTFEGLKQVLYEPEERVSIQESSPFNKNSYNLIKEVRYIDKNFTSKKIKINPNLTSIIGGKSTGKSLLLKNIAKTIDINEFHNRLKSAGLKDIKPVEGMEVVWADERTDKLGEKRENRRIIYIPQSYLNRVVDESEQSTDIDTIIEDVLLQQKNYNDWKESYIIKKNINEELIDKNIRELFQLKESNEINKEKRKKIGDIEGINKEKEHLKTLINQLKNDSSDVDIDDKLKNFESLSKAVAELQTLAKKYQDDWLKLKDFISEDSIRSFKTLSLNSKELQVIFDQLLDNSKKEFNQLIYNGIIELMKAAADEREKISNEMASKNDEINAIKKVVEKQSRLKEYLEKLSILTEKEEKISAISENIQSNIKTGKEIINNLTEYVSSYYDLLKKSQDEIKETTKDLKFKIEVDFKKNEFNNILLKYFDGRKIKTEDFKYIKDYDFDGISYFKDTLKKFIKDIVNGKMPTKDYSAKEILSGTLINWFNLKFDIEYQGDKIQEMSPGKKSFVLLRLLIELDNSKCPILIDQPEDDLDNRSITNDVVEFLKEAKKERQIIIATHNPNLVVGSDSELIIVSNQDGEGTKNKEKQFEYTSGSIEHTYPKKENIIEVLSQQGIKEHICDILEGGELAFKKRQSKYNFHSN